MKVIIIKCQVYIYKSKIPFQTYLTIIKGLFVFFIKLLTSERIVSVIKSDFYTNGGDERISTTEIKTDFDKKNGSEKHILKTKKF
jgi:hypothetical protein